MLRKTAAVSVIMPAYNAANSIETSLLSILHQTLLPREVIVIDDGSSDETANIVDKTALQFKGVTVILRRQQNKGAGAARNVGLIHASQPYIAFLDADDTWTPEKLERSLAIMEQDDYALVAHDYIDIRNDNEVHIDCVKGFRSGTDAYVQLYLKGYIASISVIVKRDAILAAGGFDESLRNAQDFDMWLAILRNPRHKFTVFNEPLARYSHTPGSIMSHTDRRISCCTKIALRYLPAIKARNQSALKNLWLRMFFIYYEASYGMPIRRMRYIIRFICALFLVSWRAFFSLLKPRKTIGSISND